MWSLFDQPKKSFNKVKHLSSRQQLAQLFKDPLYANSSFLFANTVLGSGLGFVYWIIVAQLFSASEIGLGTALVAAARLLAGFSNSGLGLGIIRFLSQTSRERGNTLINASLTFSLSIAVLLGSAYLLTLSIWSPKLLFLQEPLWAVIFLLSVALWSLAPMMDQIFLAHRAGAAVLGRNLTMHVCKLAIPFALVFAGGAMGVFASFSLAIATSCILGLWFLTSKVRPGYSLRLRLSNLFDAREFLAYSVSSHTGNYLINLPSIILPLIILDRIGESQAAYYYVAFMVASMLYSAATSLATSAFVEGSNNSGTALRRAVKATLLIVVPGIATLHVASPILLSFFGTEYLSAKGLLLALVYAAPLDAAMRLLVTYWRVNKAMITLNIFSALWAVGIVGSSLFTSELIQVGYAYIFGSLPALLFGFIAIRFHKS